MLLGGYRPYLADWDLDGDLDLALLSEWLIVQPRFFEHQANHSVSELRGGPNSSCPLNWSHPFSVTDFDGDGQLDVVGMRGIDFIDLEVLVCLQSSDGYVVMNQAGFHYCHSTDSIMVNRWVGEDDEVDREMQYVCVYRMKNMQIQSIIYIELYSLRRKFSCRKFRYTNDIAEKDIEEQGIEEQRILEQRIEKRMEDIEE